MDYTIEDYLKPDPEQTEEFSYWKLLKVKDEDVNFLFKEHENCVIDGDIRHCVFVFNFTHVKHLGNPGKWKLYTNLPYEYTVDDPELLGEKKTAAYELRFDIGINDSGKFDIYFYNKAGKLRAILDPTYGCHSGNPCGSDFCSVDCKCDALQNWSETDGWGSGAWGGGAGYYFFQGNGDCDSPTGADCVWGHCVYDVGATVGCDYWVDMCGISGAQMSTSSSSSSSSVASSSSSISSSSSTSAVSQSSSSSSSSAASTTSSSSSSSSSESSSSSSSSESSFAADPSQSSYLSSSSQSSSSSTSSSSSIGSTSSSEVSSSESSSSSTSSSSSSVIISSSSSSSSTSSSSSIVSLGSTSSSELSSSSSSSSAIDSSMVSSSESSSSSSSSNPATTTTIYEGQTYPTDCSEYGLLYAFNITTSHTKYGLLLDGLFNYSRRELVNINVSRGGATYNLTDTYRLNNSDMTTNTVDVLVVEATACTSYCDPDDNEISVYVHGFEEVNFIHTPNEAQIPTLNYTLGLSDMIQSPNVYLIDYKKEYENTAWDYDEVANSMMATIKCSTYSSYTVDLKNLNRTRVHLSTRQWPTIYVAIDEENHTRSRVFPEGQYDINYFMLAPEYDKQDYVFRLQDLTGQFPPSSFLYIYKYISATRETVFSKQFDANSEVRDVELKPGADYTIVGINAQGTTYDFGILTASQNRTIDIWVVHPKVHSYMGMYSDLQAALTASDTGDPLVKALGFIWNSTETTSARFIVRNKSDSGEVVYNSSSAASSGTFQFPIDTNYTYEMEGTLNTTGDHGNIQERRSISYRNFTQTGFFNPGFSGTLFGFSSTLIYVLISFSVSLLFFLIATKERDPALGAIVGLASLGIFSLAGWHWVATSFIGVLLTLAALAKLNQARLGVAG